MVQKAADRYSPPQPPRHRRLGSSQIAHQGVELVGCRLELQLGAILGLDRDLDDDRRPWRPAPASLCRSSRQPLSAMLSLGLAPDQPRAHRIGAAAEPRVFAFCGSWLCARVLHDLAVFSARFLGANGGGGTADPTPSESAPHAEHHPGASRCPRCHGRPRPLQAHATAVPARAWPIPSTTPSLLG